MDARSGAVRIALDAFDARVRDALRAVDAHLGVNGRAWVVGGAVRDALRPELAAVSGDLDLAVPSGALALGRAVADALGAAFVALDETRGVCRVVGAVQIDLADLRAPTLEADLAARDFTVNALAAPVRALVSAGSAPIEDPTGGAADLEARRVRLCAPTALADDPVRVLRAARLGVEPGWTLDPAIADAARAAAPGLARVSAERVRDELIALASGSATGRGLRLLDAFGALGVVLPESRPMRETEQPAPHRFDVLEHSLRAVEAMDAVVARLDRLDPWGPDLAAHLDDALGDGLARGGALKLAALLHDVAKPETRTEADGRVRFIGHDVIGAERTRAIGARLRLSRRAITVLSHLVAQHLRPMHLAQAGMITRRARYRFFRDLGEDAPDLLLLALSDASGVRGEAPFDVWAGPGGEVVRSLMAGAPRDDAPPAPPLLDGSGVMAALGLGPGPEVGRHLAALREAQALGLIRTREEAIALLRGEPPAVA